MYVSGWTPRINVGLKLGVGGGRLVVSCEAWWIVAFPRCRRAHRKEVAAETWQVRCLGRSSRYDTPPRTDSDLCTVVSASVSENCAIPPVYCMYSATRGDEGPANKGGWDEDNEGRAANNPTAHRLF